MSGKTDCDSVVSSAINTQVSNTLFESELETKNATDSKDRICFYT